MNSTDIAWLAGLLEGEGCFEIYGRRLGITLWMNDYDIVERATLLIGKPLSIIRRNQKGYRFQITKHSDIEEIARQILPYMGNRRTKRIHEILDFIEKRKNWRRKKLIRARAIRKLYATRKFTYEKLGRIFELGPRQIGNIVNNLCWKEY